MQFQKKIRDLSTSKLKEYQRRIRKYMTRIHKQIYVKRQKKSIKIIKSNKAARPVAATQPVTDIEIVNLLKSDNNIINLVSDTVTPSTPPPKNKNKIQKILQKKKRIKTRKRRRKKSLTQQPPSKKKRKLNVCKMRCYRCEFFIHSYVLYSVNKIIS